MDSYAALPLNDSAGRPLGLIAAMDRAPMRDPALAEAMLKIFAIRAVAEIERARSEAALRVGGQLSRDLRGERRPDLRPRLVNRRDTRREPEGPDVSAIRSMSFAECESASELERTALYRGRSEAVDRDSQGRPPVRFEWRARHRDGRLMWHEVRLKRATMPAIAVSWPTSAISPRAAPPRTRYA
jgi:GAF domain-containing protein